jgi:cyanophycinase-like exopeptidase
MLIKHNHEIGIGIDDQAAIVINDDQFKIVSTNGNISKLTKKIYNKELNEINERIFYPDNNYHSIEELSR